MIVLSTDTLFNMVRVWADAYIDQMPEDITGMYVEILQEAIRSNDPSHKTPDKAPCNR